MRRITWKHNLIIIVNSPNEIMHVNYILPNVDASSDIQDFSDAFVPAIYVVKIEGVQQ